MTFAQNEFATRLCVVTGGASGIGAALCKAFAAAGAQVVILDLDQAKAEALAETLPRAKAIPCNVGVAEQVNEAFGAIAADHGAVDVLVNNAGIIGGPEYKRVLDQRARNIEAQARGKAGQPLNATAHMTDSQWNLMLNTHLGGTFYCTRAALPAMQERRCGAIINMSSIIGLSGGGGIPHYAAAKAGIIGFTRAVAQEVAPLGIRVNAVAPGFIDTGLRDDLPADIARSQVNAIPMGRLGQPDEIAQTVLYLASDRASYITGQVLSPNGGYLSH
tara:strand:+ start:36401 stop:37225 length:825 start_codon:yes stop_codon:yes gene_type:complete